MDSHPCPSWDVLTADIIVPKLLIICLSPCRWQEPCLQFCSSWMCWNGALGGLNPLPILEASREGEDSLLFLPLEWGWQRLPAKIRQQTAGKMTAHSTCRADLQKWIKLILGWLFLYNKEAFPVKTGLKYSIGSCMKVSVQKAYM